MNLENVSTSKFPPFFQQLKIFYDVKAQSTSVAEPHRLYVALATDLAPDYL
jgi:hypothetical protein